MRVSRTRVGAMAVNSARAAGAGVGTGAGTGDGTGAVRAVTAAPRAMVLPGVPPLTPVSVFPVTPV